jgi:hypothetical protein
MEKVLEEALKINFVEDVKRFSHYCSEYGLKFVAMIGNTAPPNMITAL